jgi:2,5-furandicarboxylate decarboxylase 1
MGVVEKTGQASALDLDRFRLRRFVEELGADEIETRADPIDLADVAAALEGNPRAVHFRAAGPEAA